MQATNRSTQWQARWISGLRYALAVTGNLAGLAAWLFLGLCWLLVLATTPIP